MFDIDTDMAAVTHPDRVLTRRIIAAASDATALDDWLGRGMPLLFEHAGLKGVRVRGFFPLETEPQRGPVIAGRLHIFIWGYKPA